MTAPSPKEALEHARMFIKNGVEFGYIKMPDADTPDPAHKTLGKIEAALATFQPDGERREAIARINKIVSYAFNEGWTQGTIEETSRRGGRSWQEFKSRYEDEINNALASGLVQDEAGWRGDGNSGESNV